MITRTTCLDFKSHLNITIIDPERYTFDGMTDQYVFFICGSSEYKFRITEALQAGLLKPEQLNEKKWDSMIEAREDQA